MTYTDLIPKSYTTRALTGSVISGSGSTSGTDAEAYDGNNATYYRYQIYHNGDGSAHGTSYYECTWAKACHVTRAYVYLNFNTYGGNYKQVNHQMIIYLKINGSWTSIYDSGDVNDGNIGSNHWDTVNCTQDITTGWDGVTGMKVEFHSYSYSYEGDRQQYSQHDYCEVHCYREAYVEAFRIKKTSGNITIGRVEGLTGQKLRIRKGGVTYALPLLDTDDPCASPVRIYNGAAVKALALAD